jgi:hypothetical protein
LVCVFVPISQQRTSVGRCVVVTASLALFSSLSHTTDRGGLRRLSRGAFASTIVSVVMCFESFEDVLPARPCIIFPRSNDGE